MGIAYAVAVHDTATATGAVDLVDSLEEVDRLLEYGKKRCTKGKVILVYARPGSRGRDTELPLMILAQDPQGAWWDTCSAAFKAANLTVTKAGTVIPKEKQ